MVKDEKNYELNDKIRFAFYGFILAVMFICCVLACVSAAGESLHLAEINRKDMLIAAQQQEIENLNDFNKQVINNSHELACDVARLEAQIAALNRQLEAADNFVYDYSLLYTHAKDIVALCRVTLGEAGCCSDIQKAAVVWCVLNRVDISGKSIYEVASDRGQFHGYNEKWVVREDELKIVLDVLRRWQNEKITGEIDAGRVLPSEYIYFSGGGLDEEGNLANVFRDKYDFKTANYWNFDCVNPYS